MSAAYPWLVADVGGTNARFGTVAAPGAKVADVRVLPVAGHAGPAAAVRAYLEARPAGQAAPRSAAFALATAITGDRIELTNGAWSFSRTATQAELGLSTLLCLNDFEAQALSLPRLQAHQLRAWDAAPAVADVAVGSVMAVIGPGTGLGVGGVVRAPGRWLALPGEGGHATLAPADDFESEVLRQARREFAHVSAERFLSGIGLPVLCRAVAAVLDEGEDVVSLATEQIVARGLSGESPACSRTLDVFCAMLGGFAGNVALTLGSRAGVFIGGGIVPRLGERFFESAFRERFEAKGRFQPLLAGIPTALITDTLAALSGAAMALEQADG
jgi:glucokinase